MSPMCGPPRTCKHGTMSHDYCDDCEQEKRMTDEISRLRARNEELETAIREYLEAIAPEDWTTEDQMLKDVLENTNADTTP